MFCSSFCINPSPLFCFSLEQNLLRTLFIVYSLPLLPTSLKCIPNWFPLSAMLVNLWQPAFWRTKEIVSDFCGVNMYSCQYPFQSIRDNFDLFNVVFRKDMLNWLPSGVFVCLFIFSTNSIISIVIFSWHALVPIFKPVFILFAY